MEPLKAPCPTTGSQYDGNSIICYREEQFKFLLASIVEIYTLQLRQLTMHNNRAFHAD